MKAIVVAFYLVLGTLVTGVPVAERKHATPKFTSIVVFGDSFSDNVRFPSWKRLQQLISRPHIVIRETEHFCSRTVHGQQTLRILMAGSRTVLFIQNIFLTC
jgi:hypothetical protein